MFEVLLTASFDAALNIDFLIACDEELVLIYNSFLNVWVDAWIAFEIYFQLS